MTLPTPLIAGELIKRYKRFLVDVKLTDGQIVAAHCPNPGSMMGLLHDHSPMNFKLCA